ncbi:hypothetical protein [Streptomyces sp. NPDC048669]|uniref:hypothetical protein n=1 Tax=unclassified Streptomyces TaxID=2593676 RepID=UPI00343C5B4F
MKSIWGMGFAVGAVPVVVLVWHFGSRTGQLRPWGESLCVGLGIGALLGVQIWWGSRRGKPAPDKTGQDPGPGTT